MSALRRYARRELQLARLASPALRAVEPDDIVDEVLLETWDRWRTVEGPLPAWLRSAIYTRIAAAAESGTTRATLETVDDDWLGDNAAFWPEREHLTLEDVVPADAMGPQEVTALFEHVSPDEREALLLSGPEGLPLDAIADALEMDRAGVEALIESGTEQLLRNHELTLR